MLPCLRNTYTPSHISKPGGAEITMQPLSPCAADRSMSGTSASRSTRKRAGPINNEARYPSTFVDKDCLHPTWSSSRIPSTSTHTDYSRPHTPVYAPLDAGRHDTWFSGHETPHERHNQYNEPFKNRSPTPLYRSDYEYDYDYDSSRDVRPCSRNHEQPHRVRLPGIRALEFDGRLPSSSSSKGAVQYICAPQALETMDHPIPVSHHGNSLERDFYRLPPPDEDRYLPPPTGSNNSCLRGMTTSPYQFDPVAEHPLPAVRHPPPDEFTRRATSHTTGNISDLSRSNAPVAPSPRRGGFQRQPAPETSSPKEGGVQRQQARPKHSTAPYDTRAHNHINRNSPTPQESDHEQDGGVEPTTGGKRPDTGWEKHCRQFQIPDPKNKNKRKHLFKCTWEGCEHRLHGDPYQTTTKLLMIRHIEIIHLKIVNYFCPECGKGFWCKTDMDRHYTKAHTNIKDLACLDCPKRFNDSSAKTRHIEKKHPKRWAKMHPEKEKEKEEAEAEASDEEYDEDDPQPRSGRRRTRFSN